MTKTGTLWLLSLLLPGTLAAAESDDSYEVEAVRTLSFDDEPKSNEVRRRAPGFATGTSIEHVRLSLLEHDVTLVREWPDHLVVRIDPGVPSTEELASGKFLYVFEQSRLVFGPATLEESLSHFERPDAQQWEAIRLFVSADPTDPYPYAWFAWFVAQNPKARPEDLDTAIQYAAHANELTNWSEAGPLQALATAYAATGQFAEAVRYQSLAIGAADVVYEGMARRLELYEESLHGDPTERADAELVQRAAAGSAKAQFELAAFYIGNNVAEDGGILNPGIYWLEQAAGGGHEQAPNELGYCYLMARCGVGADSLEAARWFRVAVDRGDALGAYNLGVLFADGTSGFQRDEVEATRLLTWAADEGDNAAAFRVALRYGQGLGTAPDATRKQHYLEQAEREEYGLRDYLRDDQLFSSVDSAHYVIAALERRDVSTDEVPDVLWAIARAIEHASSESEDKLTVRFEDGTIMSVASEEAAPLLANVTRMAASLGSTDAQIRMAELYEEGRVVQRSLQEAEYWRRRAAR